MAGTLKTFVNNTAPRVEDVDMNGIRNENNNLISSTEQVLNAGDNDQTTKAVSVYSSKGDFYQEGAGSAANAYVLESSDSQVEVFQLKDGMRIRFRVTNTNTGASTVDINGLGAKTIEYEGASLNPNAIVASNIVTIIFDESGDVFNLEYDALNLDTLPQNIVNSSLTSVGALDSGSITSNFGNIDIGTSTIDSGDIESSGNVTSRFTDNTVHADPVNFGGIYVSNLSSTNDTGCQIRFSNEGTSSSGIVGVNDTGDSSYLKFYTENASVRDYRLTIYSNGNVKFERIIIGSRNSSNIISGGQITIDAQHTIVDTEGGAATDDLDSINGGQNGMVIYLSCESTSRNVVLKNGTGNLRLNSDFSLDHFEDTITLLHSGGVWLELSRSNNS